MKCDSCGKEIDENEGKWLRGMPEGNFFCNDCANDIEQDEELDEEEYGNIL